MPNTQLRQHIDDMPGILAKLERIPEITTRLDLIDTLRAHALSLEPLDGVETMALSDYDRDWLVRYTYNSNAIEGSTLTLQDTSLVLEGEFVPSDSPARFVFAARGVADGMAYVREYASERRELDPELIQRIHEVTALDLQPFARGTFRPYGYLARITATRVKTADPLEIHDDLQALIDGLNGSDAHPLLKAAAFHTMFENIHPFMDGNGRTGRQLLNLMLLENGYRPVAIKHDAGRVYARGLESWQVDGDSEPFCSILFDCVEQEERTFIDLVERLRHDPKTTDGSIAMDAPGQDVQPPDPADVPDDTRPDDPGIGHQRFHFLRAVSGHNSRFKVVKGGSERLSLFQNGEPGEAGLEAFQDQHLKELPVIVLRTAPLPVVVGKIDL